jgi:hypothetical protein
MKAPRDLRGQRGGILSLVVAIAVSLPSCAGLGATPGEGPKRPPGYGAAPAPDWDRPLGGLGISVATVALAGRYVAFAPLAPLELGSPKSVFVSDPQHVSRKDRVLSLVFNSPQYGRFTVNEQRSQTSQSELESLAGCDHQAGCQGTWRIVSLGSGTRVLLVVGPIATSVTWLDGALRIDILGPSLTFTADHATAVGRFLVGDAQARSP